MFTRGKKASEVIKMLQNAIDKYGDCEVFAGDGDYPEGIENLQYDAKGDVYHSPKCFKLYGWR